ncbi:tRNA epoxyqueuosine(34) reductase QueG [Tepidimonas sp. HKU79]|uniref:tRNA epoxyqueuosine(34) reductase QueG n=1 Tax=unclassified Tepidimonas TaxID=2631705 RepID=UPI003C7D84F9
MQPIPTPSGADAPAQPTPDTGVAWVERIRGWARALGFSQIGVSAVDLSHAEPGLLAWLAAGFHGTMDYMARHGLRRARPAELVPGTLSVITARMDYLPRDAGEDWRAREWARLADPDAAVVSIYARGRDYHKVLRRRLQQLAQRIEAEWVAAGQPAPQTRVFTDSAPVLEVELATRSGLGWRGKHTLALHRDAGSMFFLGEIFIDQALPPTPAHPAHCGRCQACIDVCPTGAIVAPYRLDARRCISYLTIEHEGPIPVPLRRALGNRIVGCDDCQLICPWNKYARRSPLPDFDAREALAAPRLLPLWAWSEDEFLRHTEGSAIRRIGYQRWRRNLAVALGNARAAARARGDTAQQAAIESALAPALADPDTPVLVREHVAWALMD